MDETFLRWMLNEPVENEIDRTVYMLAVKYHDITEAFDRTVCTGPIIDGGIRPATSAENALIQKHAVELCKRIFAESIVSLGVSFYNWLKAINFAGTEIARRKSKERKDGQ